MTMKRFTKATLLVASAVLVASQASLVWGLGSTSDLKQIYSFRNTTDCVVGTTPEGILNVTVAMKCGPVTNIRTKLGNFGAHLNVGAPGACTETTTTQADSAAAALCEKAVAQLPAGSCVASGAAAPLGVCPNPAGLPIVVGGGCAAALAGPGGVQCKLGPGPTDGFMINTDSGFRFSVERCGSCTVENFEADRDDGGPLWDDPAKLLIRLDPENAPRPFTVVGDAPGAPGPGPASFSVSITAGMTDLQIHTALCAGFANAGLSVTPKLPADIGLFVEPPSSTGHFFEITPPASGSVTEMGIRIFPLPTGSTELTRPDLTMQQQAVPQSAPPGGGNPVPTLSEWGMGILVTILLMTGVWMLRRRQRLQQG
jgi:hypothetical protein